MNSEQHIFEEDGRQLVDWKGVHAALLELAKRRTSDDYDTCRLLLLAKRIGVDRHLALGSFAEYAHRHCGALGARRAC